MTLIGTNAPARSAPFSGGALTTAWFSCQYDHVNTGTQTGLLLFGLGLSGTNNCLGVGTDSTTTGKLNLCKYNGTTKTVLATEGGTSLSFNQPLRFDISVANYGVTATVVVYLNGVSIITFTGDVTVPGQTNFDCVTLMPMTLTGSTSPGNTTTYNLSETFVSDSDTRPVQGLQTLALTGAGTTNGWTNNTFSNINGINFSDGSPASVNTTATDQQYTVTAPTPVSFAVAAVIVSARMAKGTTSTPTQVKLGYGNGAAGSFGTGAAKTVTTGFQSYQQIDAINPVTGVAFTQANISALQLDIQSA
jgi:hypothetical protein